MIYDVIIVGAGPAGATFAREVAVHRENVLLIDNQSGTNKKPCGGLLAPDAQRVFAEQKLTLPKKVLTDPQIFAVKTVDICSGSTRLYPRNYLNMDRYAFDKWLVSLVPHNVTIADGRCRKIVREGDIFSVQVLVDGLVKTYKAHSLVGADGAGSMVRRQFFGDTVMRYVAIQQWFKNTSDISAEYYCVFDRETSESCSWLMHKDDDVIYGGCFSPQNCRKNFDIQKKRFCELTGIPLDGLHKTEACITYRPKKFADFVTGKNAVYLIGEAAGFISASSFEGISSALLSGAILADAFGYSSAHKDIALRYRRKTATLRLKLATKMLKHDILYNPFLRKMILKSGICSI